jgi:hypothetical protein
MMYAIYDTMAFWSGLYGVSKADSKQWYETNQHHFDDRHKTGLQIQFLMYHNNEQQTYLMNYFQKLFKYHLQ